MSPEHLALMFFVGAIGSGMATSFPYTNRPWWLTPLVIAWACFWCLPPLAYLWIKGVL